MQAALAQHARSLTVGAGILAILLGLPFLFDSGISRSNLWAAIAAGAAVLLGLLVARILQEQRRHRNRFARFKESFNKSEERYRAFIQNSAEAIWRYELERPVPVALSEDQQIEHFYRFGYLAECNRTMAIMYGFDDPAQMVGMRLNDILPRENPRNIEFLRRFIQGGYHLVDAESDDVDRHGNIVHALNNMIGVIEDGYGVRVWGTNRDITEQRQREQEAIAREQQQSALAELSQRAVIDTDIQAAIDRAAKLVHQALGVDYVGVLKFEPADGQFVMRAGVGWKALSEVELVPADLSSQAGFTLLSSPRITRGGLETHDPIVFEDIRTDTRFQNSRLLAHGVVSAVTVMIHGEHHPYGMLGVYTKRPRTFSTDQVEFIQAVANLMAAVVIRQSDHDALRRSEEQNRTLVEQVKDYAIFMIDPDGRATSWNEGVKRVLGYNEDEFVGRAMSDLFTPADVLKGVPRRELDEAITRSQSSNDRWMVRKDGRRFWASGITTALRDEDGRLLGFTKVMRDHTERRRVEMQLRRSQRSLSSAQRIAHIGNWELKLTSLTDIHSNALTWSDEVFRIFGFEPGQFTPSNQKFFERVHPDDREAIERGVRDALHGSGMYAIQHRIMRPDGSERVVQEQAQVEYDRRGRPQQMIGTVQDITERKRAEIELEHYRDHLEQLVARRSLELEESHQRLRHTERMAALGTLSAGLGHDMGNLLLPIRVRLDAIESKQGSSSISEDLQVIRMATEYLQRLSNGLRLLAIDPDRAGHIGEPTNIDEWWLDAEPILKNALPPGVALKPEFESSLPILRLPRHQFTQVVFNLVQNAGDALRGMPNGEVRVRVHPVDDRQLHVAVSDNGPGMSPEVMQRCLEPFFTTKTRSISTGLGLALVHGIIQRAGGRLEVQSALGKGTTIAFTLDAEPAQSTTKMRHEGAVAVVSLSDPRMRSFVTSLLHSSGYQVVEAASAQRRSDVNLWLSDLVSTDLDVIREFIDADSDHRHVVLFGNATERINRTHILELGDRPRPAVVRRTLDEIARSQTASTARSPS